MGNKLGKCLLFTAVLAVVDIGVISWLFQQESLIASALGITAGIMSVIFFFLVNYRVLTARDHGKGTQVNKLKEEDEFYDFLT